MLSILSIDIGLKNLAIYKEYFSMDKAKLIKKPLKRYDKYGAAHPEMEEYINEVATCGQCIFMDKNNLGERKDFFSSKAFINLYDYLEELDKKDVFRDVNVILIEKQLKINPTATVLMNHIHAWFLINFGTFKKVILYPSKNKTRILGASLKVENEHGKAIKTDKKYRKKWAVVKAENILNLREDVDTLSIFEKNKSKRDDIADTLIQALSYNVQILLREK
jgi:hypothetical protein